MTTSNRWLFFLLVSVVLAGCQGLHLQQKGSLTEAESFAKGLDQYIETGDLQPLKMLPKEYPDGAWGPRAELVVRLAEQQEQLVADKDKTIGVKEAGQTKQALRKDQELARCDNEMAALRKNNQDLTKTIDQLKKLLIDMESRSN
jgi:DNA polymerase/3'-5' exonuclease PolX